MRAVQEDREGNLWIGTDGGGLNRLRDGRITAYTTADGLPSDTIHALLEDGPGLWIATNRGLSRLEQGQIRSWTTRDGLCGGLVRALHLDARGTLWIGTNGGGLCRFRDGRFTSYTRSGGLFDDVVFHILEDARGQMWMSCNRGIFRVALSELEDVAAGRTDRVRSVSYDRSDGMKSRECNGGFQPAGWKARDGRLWFPTIRGAVVVNPERLTTNPLPPGVVIEEAVIDGAPVRSRGLVEQRHGQGELEFHYAGLSLFAPEKVRFRYRLAGFDEHWVEAGGRRVAYYTNIPPGSYVFEVLAANADGVWSETAATFAVRFAPRFYQTSWFVALCAGAVIAAAIGLHRFRVAQLRAREKELVLRVEEAVSRIKVLSGLLPICAWCKKIRDDTGYWNQLETYIRDHSQADFSHGICPDCRDRVDAEFRDSTSEG